MVARIGIICPLDEEFYELLETFDLVGESSSLENAAVYRCALTNRSEAFFALPSEKSDAAAAVVSMNLIQSFQCSALVSFGIAGGLAKECLLGDVCVSSSITDLAQAKRNREQVDGGHYSLSDNVYDSPGNIKLAIRALNFDPSRRAESDVWAADCENWKSQNLPSDATTALEALLAHEAMRDRPKWHFGRIASFGGVIDDPKLKDTLIRRDPDLLAVETECAGIAAAARNAGIPSLSVRGISDFADGSKKTVDGYATGRVRNYAARNAALFLKTLLQSERFLLSARPVSGRETSGRNLVLDQPEPPPIEQVYIDVRQALTELLPPGVNYLQGSLPVPKLQKVLGPGKQNEDIGVFDPDQALTRRKTLPELLETQSCIVITVNDSRFDTATPYLLADSLYSRQLGDKLCITYVSHCDTFKGYKGLESLERTRLGEADVNFTQSVYLIYGLRPNHRPTQNLLKFVAANRETKFVLFGEFVDPGGNNHDYVDQLNRPLYRLVEPSVGSISQFLEQQLGYEENESEQHAIKIRATFQRFEIPMSLNYLVRFTRESVNRFLEANSILEITELFLNVAILDAAHASRIASRNPLSAATRKRFLDRLVGLLFFERVVVPRAEVEKVAADFSIEFGLEMPPALLLRPFFDSNVLVELYGNVSFSIELVRLYFVAKALAANPKMLLKHVEAHGEWVSSELVTLQLAAEMEANVGPVIDYLADAVASEERSGEQNEDALSKFDADGLLGDIMAISNARESEGAMRVLEKARIDPEELEFIENMQDYAADFMNAPKRLANDESVAEQQRTELKKRQERLVRRMQYSAVCATILGSGAESLTAREKNRLAGMVITLAAETLCIHLEINAEGDAQDAFDNRMDLEIAKRADLEDAEGFTHFVEHTRTVFGLMFRVMPLLLSTTYFRLFSKNVVLLSAVNSVDSKSDSAKELIKRLWLLFISPKAGGPKLIDIVKKDNKLSRLRPGLLFIVKALESSPYSVADMEALHQTARELAPRGSAPKGRPRMPTGKLKG